MLEKIKSKTKKWKIIFISQAGQATLIKSSLQFIPTYFMQTKILKKTECATLDKSYKNYFLEYYTHLKDDISTDQKEKKVPLQVGYY